MSSEPNLKIRALSASQRCMEALDSASPHQLILKPRGHHLLRLLHQTQRPRPRVDPLAREGLLLSNKMMRLLKKRKRKGRREKPKRT